MMRKIALKYHTVKDIMQHYKVSRRTAFYWLRQGYAVVRTYPTGLPKGIDYKTIAKRSAWYVCARQGDIDLLHEAEQAALIGLWKESDAIESANNQESIAHTIARSCALQALRDWRKKTVSFDDWLAQYEQDGSGSLDMDSTEYDATDRMI